MDPATAYSVVEEAMRRLYDLDLRDLRPSEVRGYWEGRDGLYLFREDEARRADGRYDSPYRTWHALTGPVTDISRDSMGFGCPTCGAPFDRIEVSGAQDREDPMKIRVAGPQFAICQHDHRFRLNPNVIRG